MAQLNNKLPFHDTQTSKRVELWIGLIFLFGIIEAAFRKWLLPHNWFLPQISTEIGYFAYLSKDIAFALLCLLTRSSCRAPLIKQYGTIVKLSIFLIVMGAILSSFAGVNWAGAFLNFRSMLLLPMLSYFAVSRLTNINIRRIAYWVAWLSLLPAGLGMVQIILPKTHMLNIYADPDFSVITFGGQVRAAGTIAFISGMASMSILAVWAGLLLHATAKARKDIIIGWIAVSAGLACACTAVSRSGLFLSLGFICIVFIFGRLKNKSFIFCAGFVLAALGLFYQQNLKGDRLDPVSIATVVFERHRKSDSFMGRGAIWEDNFVEAISQAALGEGFGIGQVGGAYVATGESQLLRHEYELARIVSETGLIGLIGTLLLRIWIIYKLFSIWIRLPNSANRSGLFVCVIAVLIFLLRNNAFDHVASGFSWPLIAISMAWAIQQLNSVEHATQVGGAHRGRLIKKAAIV